MVWTHLGLDIYSQGRRTAKQIAGCQIHCDQVRALFPVVLILANAVPLVKRPCQATDDPHRPPPADDTNRLPTYHLQVDGLLYFYGSACLSEFLLDGFGFFL